MRNSYFKFKQFTIQQANCANKVSTDACVFGAYLAQLLPDDKKSTILDVGCGSGLLSLMLAQKNHHVTGIEIEHECAHEAMENAAKSPFSQSVTIIHSDVRKIDLKTRYDFIISNPPFFNNSFASKNEAKNKARQNHTLNATNWQAIIEKFAHKNTMVAFLLSNNDVKENYKMSLHTISYNNQHEIAIYDKKNADCKRVILLAQKNNPLDIPTKSIVYKNKDNSYTASFVTLLKEFYLYLKH